MTRHLLRNVAVFLTASLTSGCSNAADQPMPWNVIVAVAGCALVRLFIWTESKNKLLAYNLSISAIAVLGAAVYTIDHNPGLSGAFAVGLGTGAGAVGLVEFAKSKFLIAIKEALLKSLSGTGTPPEQP